MSFISTNSTVISFASYDDVLQADQRLFEANEGLTEDVVEQDLIRATQRILTAIKFTSWWRECYLRTTTNPTMMSSVDLPDVNPSRIVARQADFTDLCVYHALYFYILPRIADFSKEDNAERAKIGFNQNKYNQLFEELVNQGDWYDFNGDGTVNSTEKFPGHISLRRTR